METLATQARGSCTVVSTITGINNNGLLEVLSRDGSLPFKQLTPYNRKKQHYCYWNNAVLILILKQYTGNILKIYTYQSRLRSRWVGLVLKLFASMFGKVSISMGTDSWGTEDDRRWYWYLLPCWWALHRANVISFVPRILCIPALNVPLPMCLLKMAFVCYLGDIPKQKKYLLITAESNICRMSATLIVYNRSVLWSALKDNA